MYEIYLVTGVTGFLGRAVMKALLREGKKVVGLRMPQDKRKLLPGAEYEVGDITKPYTLSKFFGRAEGKCSILIHSAGMVAIGSDGQEQLWRVNVEGTKHMIDLSFRYEIDRFVYISSVHAIREEPKGTVIKETHSFSADTVKGAYGKSKAEATTYVLKAAERGMDAVVVHPSGIIGPEDYSGGYMTETIRAFLKGRFPFSVEGGYDFVDVRDVAEAIIKCADCGKRGETYILSNEYITVKQIFEILSETKGKKKSYKAIPLKMLLPFAALIEKAEQKMGLPMLITPYSLYTLGSNGNFSHEKADSELQYAPRPVKSTLWDIARWMNESESGRSRDI